MGHFIISCNITLNLNKQIIFIQPLASLSHLEEILFSTSQNLREFLEKSLVSPKPQSNLKYVHIIDLFTIYIYL